MSWSIKNPYQIMNLAGCCSCTWETKFYSFDQPQGDAWESQAIAWNRCYWSGCYTRCTDWIYHKQLSLTWKTAAIVAQNRTPDRYSALIVNNGDDGVANVHAYQGNFTNPLVPPNQTPVSLVVVGLRKGGNLDDQEAVAMILDDRMRKCGMAILYLKWTTVRRRRVSIM